MGRAKLLLPWHGTTVLGHLLREWEALQARQVGVVVAPEAAELLREMDRLETPRLHPITNAAADRGMFSSIQCAAAWRGWNPDLTHWVVALGDQPHLRRETLRELLACSAANPDRICQPLRQGRRRHPVLLPRPLFRELASSPAVDFKQFLQAHPAAAAGFESADAGLDFDLNTPEDYERACRLFA